MIYLTEGNIPLNAAYDDDIVQEANSIYQLTFKFPTNDILWQRLREEKFLTADDLHGEQDFVIFEVEKKHGYIQVYANQVMTMLNHYVVNPMSLDRATGSTALSQFAGSITRSNPFSFFSDIDDRHTFNIDSKTAMEALTKDKHSIVGLWGGDLVRHGYQVRLLKNGGSENESLFMYKKNLSSYQHKTSTKSLKTRIIFTTTVKGEGEKAPDRTFTVTIDSPLINKYSQIYEDVAEVNDQDVKDEASLREYGKQYFRTTLCDMLEDSLEIEVVGQSDVPVQMFDVVSIFHEHYNLDVRKKITKYIYSPMAKKLKSIGFGQFQSGLANAIGNAVSDVVKGEAQQLQSNFEQQLASELKNADLDFDRKKEELVNQFTDGLNAAKARAEEIKRQLSDTIDQRFNSFDVSSIAEAKRKAEEALEKSGANTSLIDEALLIGKKTRIRLDRLKRDFESAGEITDNILGEIDRNLKKEINTTSEYRRTTDEMLSRMTGQMNGFATKSEVRQDVTGLTETFAKLKIDTNNLISETKSEITAAKTEFNKTADGLSTKMTAVERYVNQDSQRQEALQRYAREESAKQATSVRELVTRDYVGKATYQEDVRGINQRIEEAKKNASNELTTRLANYRQTVDGKFTDISSQVTTYKQVADGQIANLSNRLTTEKQGTDGKIANLTNQVTTNKASSDNQIANLSNQLAKKVEITDFQRVRETSQLYERILGTTEQGLPDKVSRLVMSSSIFQTEVGNFFVSDNNLIVNSETLDKYTLVGQRSGVSLGPQNGIFAINAVGLTSFNWSGFTLPIYVPKILKGEVYTISFKYKIKRKLDHEFRVNIKNHFKNKAVLQKVVANPSDPISSDWIEFQATSTMSEDFEFGSGKDYPLYFYLVKNGYVEIKEPILVRGSRSSSYKPSQFDDAYKATENAKQLAENAQAKAVQVAEQVNQAQQIAEATRTRVNQLAGSWAVQNLTSAGSIVSQINATNNQILIEAEKIRLKGKTLLDELTAIQGYFKRLFVGEGTFATLNADVIRANSITADKLIFDQAMANKFTANNLLADSLFAKQAFINRVQSVAIDASQVRSGILSGDRIYGGTIRGASIYGGTLTGHTKIQLGSYGSFDTVNGGLQINVPRTVDSKDGLGVQFIGSYGRGEDVPYGLFIYKDSDFTTGNTASDSDDFLLTVEGYIKAKGIGWFKTSKGNVGGKDTAKIGYWNSNISLDFGGSGNDIYYTYNGSAYSLWEVINKHFSDRRLKENIVICEHKALDYIQQFQFKEYDWKKQEDRPQQAHTKIGLIAQEVQEVDPTLVYKNGDTLNLDNLRLTNIALKAIQELALENKKLKHRLEKLENE
nr:MAG TPA: Neck appendage protein [Caudoviricetes sp.]